MKTHMVVIEFARRYGIKEGLILTELCRRVYVSGVIAVPFSVSQGKDFFPYMSEKQIRLSLHNLKAAGCIAIAHNSPTVDRTQQYGIQESIYKFYTHILMSDQLTLPGGAEPHAGGR
jgi:hypothetical protein